MVSTTRRCSPGTPVYSADEVEVGVIEAILDNFEEHIFDGVVFQGFSRACSALPTPRVARTAERGVVLAINAEEAKRSGRPRRVTPSSNPTGAPVVSAASFGTGLETALSKAAALAGAQADPVISPPHVSGRGKAPGDRRLRRDAWHRRRHLHRGRRGRRRRAAASPGWRCETVAESSTGAGRDRRRGVGILGYLLLLGGGAAAGTAARGSRLRPGAVGSATAST